MKSFFSTLFALCLLVFPAGAQQVTVFPPASLPLSGSETLYLVQGGHGRQTTVGNLPSGGGSGIFASPPPLGNVTPNTVAATSLTAVSSSVQYVVQPVTTTWSGAYPGANNIALYSLQNYTGTLSSLGFAGVEGHSPVYNLISITDNLNYTIVGPGAKTALDVVMTTQSGQGNATGAIFTYQFLPTADYPSSGPIFSPVAVYGVFGGHIAGATSGTGGIGDFYGIGIDLRQVGINNGGSPTFMHAMRGIEIDMSMNGPSGSSVNDLVALNLGSASTGGYVPTTFGAYIAMYGGGSTGSPTGRLQYGISFGNPESNIAPVSATGTMIGSTAIGGTTVNYGLDFSNMTFTTAFLHGPNGFYVLGNNWVITDSIRAATGNTVGLLNNPGTLAFSATGSGTLTNSLQAVGASTGNGTIFQTVSATDANVTLLFRTGGTSGSTPTFDFQNAGGSLSILALGGVANPTSGFQMLPTASGNVNFDTDGTPTGMNIGTVNATSVVLGKNAGTLGFYGGSAIAKATPTGACAGSTGCQALRDALANLGLINASGITN